MRKNERKKETQEEPKEERNKWKEQKKWKKWKKRKKQTKETQERKKNERKSDKICIWQFSALLVANYRLVAIFIVPWLNWTELTPVGS